MLSITLPVLDEFLCGLFLRTSEVMRLGRDSRFNRLTVFFDVRHAELCDHRVSEGGDLLPLLILSLDKAVLFFLIASDTGVTGL